MRCPRCQAQHYGTNTCPRCRVELISEQDYFTSHQKARNLRNQTSRWIFWIVKTLFALAVGWWLIQYLLLGALVIIRFILEQYEYHMIQTADSPEMIWLRIVVWVLFAFYYMARERR